MSSSVLGRVVGHYRIVERLGSGGMGVVYKAEDTHLGRTVALKFLPLEWSDDEEWRRRFLREAQAASALDHSGICTIHGVEETADGQCFICMGYYEGQTLQQRLAGGPLAVEEALDIAIQTAEALAFAHEAGVVHRDVKPANLMITRRGQVKVLDFGLAKRSGSPVTRPGAVVGTAAFMSPEQITGLDVDHRTDIWSLGVVLYEMLTGRRPFTAPSDPAILLAILTRELVPLGEARPGLSPELEQVVTRALAKEPGERFQRMEEMLEALRQVAGSSPPGSWPSATPAGRVFDPSAGGPLTQRTKPLGERRLSPARPARGRSTARLAAVGLSTALVLAVAGWLALREVRPRFSGEANEADRKMIVVLPFENLGAPQDAYFAAGVTDEITSRLATIPELGVISRTSAVASAGQGKTVRQIGDELGVHYLLEGTVRWDHPEGGASRVRISPRLVRVSDDTDLWSESYDRVVDDLFEVQSEIAEQVTARLDITLLPGQRSGLAAVPTANLDAYQAYLRGRELLAAQPTLEGQNEAVVQLEAAVSLDPGFALAWAQLARAQAYVYRVGYDRSPRRRDAANHAMEEAVRLAPDAPEVHLAQAYYQYWVRGDLDRALTEVAAAERGMPSNAEVITAAGLVLRRRGLFEEALEKLTRAARLSPRSAEAAFDVGGTLLYLRRYAEAERWLQRSLSLEPDQLSAPINLAELYRVWRGSTAQSRSALEQLPRSSDPNLTHHWYLQHLFEGDHEAALALLEATPDPALDLVEYFEPKALLEAWVWRARGETERARLAFDHARLELEELLPGRPDDPRLHAALGLAYAGLGRPEEAWREGERAVELLPGASDAVDGPYHLADLALIYALTGRHDSALDTVESLLAVPAPFSLELLELDPRWSELRREPRYQALRDAHR